MARIYFLYRKEKTIDKETKTENKNSNHLPKILNISLGLTVKLAILCEHSSFVFDNEQHVDLEIENVDQLDKEIEESFRAAIEAHYKNKEVLRFGGKRLLGFPISAYLKELK